MRNFTRFLALGFGLMASGVATLIGDCFLLVLYYNAECDFAYRYDMPLYGITDYLNIPPIAVLGVVSIVLAVSGIALMLFAGISLWKCTVRR